MSGITGSQIISFLNLGVSITDWCEHGALLTSAVIMVYATWLTYEAFSLYPQDIAQMVMADGC